MDAANADATRALPRHALAGLQAGVLGAVAMILWLMLASVWTHRSIWLVPNLFATTFFGPNAYNSGLQKGSASGIALMLVIYGLGGIFWGVSTAILWREQRKRFLLWIGAFTGLLVYFLLFDVIWKHTNPLIPLYAPDLQLEVGHVLWGLMLARTPRYVRNIALATAERPASGTETASQESAAEVNRGDSIR